MIAVRRAALFVERLTPATPPSDRAQPASRGPPLHAGGFSAAPAARRRRAFCTERSAALALANGRERRSTVAGFLAIVISSPVAGLRPLRAFCAGLTRTVNCTS